VKEHDRIRLIKEKAEDRLFQIPGVHGVGIGYKHIAGKYTNELAIKVYVREKIAVAEIPSTELIPPEIEGVKTDVVKNGSPHLSAGPDTKKYRPARGGSEIEVFEIQPDGTTTITSHGTLGFFARTTNNPPIVVGVTNHHVLAVTGTLRRGDSVGQASPKEYTICSKCCSEIIGVILDGVFNLAVDVGLIRLNRKLEYYNQIEDTPTGFLITGEYSLQQQGIPAPPYVVKKRGAATQHTTGTIDSIDATFRNNGVVTHTKVISIRPDAVPQFNDTGDSGSAVVDKDGKIIGLLFAKDSAGQGFGFAMDISVVKSELANMNLPIEILTASSLGAKQTVPDNDSQANAYRVAEAWGEASNVRVAVEDEWLQKVQDEVLQTPDGPHYVGLFQHHYEEVQTLVNKNKRVATAWHRNGGPLMIRHALEALKTSGRLLPTEIEGLPIKDRLNRIMQVLAKYGSADLTRDIRTYGASLARLSGQTYNQILEALRAGAVAKGSGMFPEEGVT
jgi:hypothetical protein